MKSPINSAEKKKPTTIQVVLFTVIICLLVAIAFAGGVLVGYYVNEEPFDYYDYDYYYGIEETGEDLSRASARRLHPTFSKPSIHYSIKEITSELKSTNHLERSDVDATFSSFKALDQSYLLSEPSKTVIGIINGAVEAEHYILVGGSRDRINQHEIKIVANSLRRMKENKSWRPRRSVIFVSWKDQDSMKQWIKDFYYKLNGRLVAYFDINSMKDDNEDSVGTWNWLYVDFLKNVSSEIKQSIDTAANTDIQRLSFLAESIVRLSSVEALPISYSTLAQKLSQNQTSNHLSRVLVQISGKIQQNLEKGISNKQHELVNDRAIKMSTMLFFSSMDNTDRSNQINAAILILKDGFDSY